MRIYQVLHYYDVDGGFGDAVGCSDVIACFESEADAKAFCEKWDRTHVYDVPYAELECGTLGIVEMELVTHEEFSVNNRPSHYGYSRWVHIEDWEEPEQYSDTEPLMSTIAEQLGLDEAYVSSMFE